MKTTDLLNLYRDFSEEEITEFERFLKSPYFVNVKSSYSVFREIIRNRNLIVLCAHEKLFGKLRRKFKYTSGALSKQFSYLSKATLNFLKVRSLLTDGTKADLILGEYLLNHNYFNVLNKSLSDLSNIINNGKVIGKDSLLNSYYYNMLSHDCLLKSGVPIEKKIADREFIHLKGAAEGMALHSLMQLTVIFIDYFYLDINLGNKNKYIFPVNLHLIYDEYEKSGIFAADASKKAVFGFYRVMYNAVSNKNNIEYYFEFKKCVEDTQSMFSPELIKYHYQALINFCMLKDRLGEEREFFRKESVELLYRYFNDGYFKAGPEYIHHIEYSNFVIKAFSIGDYEKIKSFIEKNSTMLHPAEYNDMVNYGLAYYYFGVKEYRQALKCINSIPIKDFYYKFDMLNVELRIYYELNKKELLRDAIHNYRSTTLEDNMLTAADKAGLLKMLNYLNKLISVNEELDTEKQRIQAEYVLVSLNKEPVISLKKWLTERFEMVVNQKRHLKTS
jgi:hypothetical protein